MLNYESQVVINRPPDDVFPYLVELERQALWSDVPMTPLTEGPIGPGSRIEVTFGMGPIKAIVGLEFAAVEPGRRVEWRTFSGPIRWTGEYVLTPVASGTSISQSGQLVFTGLWRLLEPVAGAEIKSGETKELERLKAVVEQGNR